MRFYPLIFLIVLFLFSLSSVKSETRRTVYDSIPEGFEQYQDSAGFLWQVNKNGSLSSGTTEYLSSGLRLHIEGSAFQPQRAELVDDREDGGHLDLTVNGGVNDFTIERQFWFDLQRSAVRVIDVITNNGAESQTPKVSLQSAFQFPWQNLVGTTGEILGSTNPIKLGDSHGVATKFSVNDGRQDTLILSSIEGVKDNGPVVEASANARQLSLNYRASLNPGDRIVLVHWMVRRNLSKLDDLVGISEKFIDRGVLINPRVSSSLRSQVVNFPVTAFVEEVKETSNLEQLVQLNQLIESRSIKRSTKDSLYIGANNYLEGRINPEAVVLNDNKSIQIGKIAAIEGGGGVGRSPRVYLRDGQVVAGELQLENGTFQVGNNWLAEPLEIAGLDFLLLASQSADGTLPAQTQVLIEMRDGTVLAAKSIAPIEVVTAWGGRKIEFADIDRFYYQSLPTPEFRLHHNDGSFMGVFPRQQTVSVETVDGETVDLNLRSISTIRKAGESAVISLDDRQWLAPADIPQAFQPKQGFLLQGNNVVPGSFIDLPSLTLLDGTDRIAVTTGEIKAITRSGDSEVPQFKIELLNGNTLKGSIIKSTIKIGVEGNVWQVPVRHLVGYVNNQGGQEDEE